ncbi:hypothetical protein QAD02_008796 [Eretmocerus hayati]|uniref:Uncharacterized protein n=1 Tax=Eretmocerus hayati TaxID=131215 RepID=A0ACC2N7E7_9HYME|nr:hypothetical protein QAD02_008796 [Eretmocerus hayati]
MASVAPTVQKILPQQPATSAAPQVQEFSIRVPKNTKKRYNVMRFNAHLKVDFKEWKQVKMERENNMKDFKESEEEIPKFGAGSEFGREAREEARRKKFGITSRRYRPEDQPWLLKLNGKSGKKFRGIREGGVGDNASYYVFTHAPDGAIEAFPLNEWYNFQTVQRFKALSAEEAEQEFSRRNKSMNYFNLMMRKRLRNDEEDGEDAELLEGEKKKRSNKKEKDLKISEMDEWMDSDDDDASDSDEKEDKKKSDDEEASKKKKKIAGKKKKKKNVSDDEAFEESDDGDEEGRECDYISDSSASDSELELQKEIKSVAEEDALRKLLASDEEEDDEDQSDRKDDDEKNDSEEGKDKDDKDKDRSGKSGDKKKDKKKGKKKKDDVSDSSADEALGTEHNRDKEDKKPPSSQNSRATTPTVSAGSSSQSEAQKRPLNVTPDPIPMKKPKVENNYSLSSSSSYISGSSESGITEDAVRRYLMRKPMTTTELLQKFKAKKTGLSSEQIVTVMTKILKNISPISQKIKGKMYFSLKAQPNQQPH